MAIIRLTKKDNSSMLLSTDEIRKVERIISGCGPETVISTRSNTCIYVQESVDDIEAKVAEADRLATVSLNTIIGKGGFS